MYILEKASILEKRKSVPAEIVLTKIEMGIGQRFHKPTK